MAALTRIGRLWRLGTLPETRRLVIGAARSASLRDLARRAARDRAALIRDLRHRANARELARDVVRHPATQELASASVLFLPGRFLPLGWAASWATRRILRRFLGTPQP